MQSVVPHVYYLDRWSAHPEKNKKKKKPKTKHSMYFKLHLCYYCVDGNTQIEAFKEVQTEQEKLNESKITGQTLGWTLFAEDAVITAC